MLDEPMHRLLAYDRRRYWLENGWSLRFRVALAEPTAGRPRGIKYAFTLHDVDRTRLLGFDNAHGLPRVLAYDHRHRFRRTAELVAYEFRGADELICDFFDQVERACRRAACRSNSWPRMSRTGRGAMKRTNLAALRDEMRAVARGERAAPPRPAGPLLAALSAEALELMSVVLERHPASVGEVVRLTGRSQPNVSRSLQQLAGHGFVRLVRTGREVRPEPLVRSLEVDLATGTYRTEPASDAAPA